MNDEERRQWVLNDEGLYRLWRSSGRPMKTFIRENREALDLAINPVLSGEKPAHHLAYGPGRRA